ncbi:type IV secretion protein Rhs [Mucilaginibacter conchicola]|uniref:Type IV secretion protein Rhs n=1 Tax=Mucilaginibacter conchicola TaxID=2303333 RepID=A0A372NTP7_9SPHI|nr:phage baseplate assembly protein V [Mucilaginibacter conchicola]RFZ92281.1 type IV secretion protein Rhs [Mucilaginibacter conchicola]
METKIKVDISIEGTPITHFSSFNLEQRFNEHQSFQLRFNHHQIENTNKVTLEKSKDFIGKNLTVQFGRGEESEHQFTGKITRVEIAQSHGFQGDIVISGFSPTVLIDRGPDLGSYLNKDLKTIVQKATEDAPKNDLNFNINPAYTSPIDYIIQYRESDFDFINRLSAEYHEWFYYDGVKLNFGKPSKLDEVPLIYGRDLHSLQYGLQIAPLKYQKFAYHSPEDQLLSSQPSPSNGGNPDLSHVISASNQVYSKQYNEPLDVRVNNQKEIDTFVNDEHKAIVSELLSIMGNGDNPHVKLGSIVNISTSMRAESGFQVQDFGKFLVTAVYHQLDGVGHYQNTFEGVSADSEKLPVRNAEKPMPDIQLANVVDNTDPQGQGRVKVKFKWQCTSNDNTEWLRVMTPDAGNSDKVSKNRGFVFIPEVGDQVVVAFEEGNIARPFILGSVFHGKNGSGGAASNNSKSVTSKSGHTIFMDDAAGILVRDKTGLNHIFIDGNNAITATADNNVNLQTGGVMITLNKEEDKIVLQAKNIEIRAAENFSISGDGGPTKNGSMSFDTKLDISVKNDLSMSGEANAKLNSAAVNIVGTSTVIDGKPVKINS